MRRHNAPGVLRFALALLILALGCAWPRATGHPICAEAPYSPPPATFTDSDLVGTWEAHYDAGLDRLTLRADGTFKQVYEERVAHVVKLYLHETPWNRWWVERFPDGRLHLHLQGARYYIDGVSIAELDGMQFGGPDTWPQPGPLRHQFYDPFAHESVKMVNELILSARMDSAGHLLLHHMSYSSDQGGFAMFGCQKRHFRRVQAP